jgi:hypothetical protein
MAISGTYQRLISICNILEGFFLAETKKSHFFIRYLIQETVKIYTDWFIQLRFALTSAIPG